MVGGAVGMVEVVTAVVSMEAVSAVEAWVAARVAAAEVAAEVAARAAARAVALAAGRAVAEAEALEAAGVAAAARAVAAEVAVPWEVVVRAAVARAAVAVAAAARAERVAAAERAGRAVTSAAVAAARVGSAALVVASAARVVRAGQRRSWRGGLSARRSRTRIAQEQEGKGESVCRFLFFWRTDFVEAVASVGLIVRATVVSTLAIVARCKGCRERTVRKRSRGFAAWAEGCRQKLEAHAAGSAIGASSTGWQRHGHASN